MVDALPDPISLVTDEQTTPEAYCIRVFSSFLSSNAHGFEIVCLAPFLIDNGTTKNAAEQIKLLAYNHKICGK